MSEEEAAYGTTGVETGDDGGNAGSEEYEAQLSDSDLIKLELLKGLIAKNVNLSDTELAELTGFPATRIADLRQKAIEKLDEESEPKSWDYVLAFDVGSTEDKDYRKPTSKELKHKDENDNDDEWEKGMEQRKYWGQIFNDIWQRLQAAKLSVQGFRSADKETMFLIVGITEENLRFWADERDTDLLIDPKGGVLLGRKKHFALATRTLLDNEQKESEESDDGNGDTVKRTIDLSNWQHLYGEYSQQADASVYTHYKRTRDNNDDYETPFDEKTRLRIIYECMIADTNEGGAEIKISDLLLNKKHPLKAVFPYHDPEKLEYFEKEWIKNCNPMKLFWCPLSEIRDYFGEPVAFYFGFLSFYLKWLVAPAIVGVIFFIWQMAVNEIAVTGIPFLCFFMIFWSVAFVDFWAREESRYRLMWGMTKFQQKAVARPQFVGEWTHDKVTGLLTEEFSLAKRACRYSVVYSFVTLWLGACVVAVIVVLSQRDSDPNNTLRKIGLGVANAVMIFLFDIIYKVVSSYGNEWENHRTEQDYQNAMILKSFCFKFINSFASLVYLAFIRPTLTGPYYYVHFYTNVCEEAASYMQNYLEQRALGNVKNSSATLSSTDQELEKWFAANTDPDDDGYKACLADTSETVDECIKYVQDKERSERNEAWSLVVEGWFTTNGAKGACSSDPKDIADSSGRCPGACEFADVLVEQNEAVLEELRIQLLTLFLTAIVIQNTLEVGLPFLIQKIKANKEADAPPKSEAAKQADKDRYANTIDDMSELIIQFGFVTLFVMAFPLTPLLAILNNIIEMKVDATNLVKTSQRPDPNGAYGLGSWNEVLGFFSIISVGCNAALITFRTKLVKYIVADTVEGAAWVFLSILVIVLGIIVGMEKWIIPDVPLEVEQAIERQRLVESVLILGAGVDIESDERDGDDDDEEDDAAGIGFNPATEYIDVDALRCIDEDVDGDEPQPQA